MTAAIPAHAYPSGLLDWAGHRSGGVRRLFHSASGRPSGSVIQTPLLAKLSSWVLDIASDREMIPNVVLLIGGPGNGKTEAIEAALEALDKGLGLDGALTGALSPHFNPPSGKSVPRKVDVDLTSLSATGGRISIGVVQDASVANAETPAATPASLLLADLLEAQAAPASHLYLACVNRGVLDDALTLAIDQNRTAAQALLESIIRAVGLSPSAPSCWPLAGWPAFAIWPMDVESLVAGENPAASPAGQLLAIATDPSKWPPIGQCPAGKFCPFCTSRELLSSEPYRSSLISALRLYELGSGKRWSFRDLFTLYSYLFAGAVKPDTDSTDDPCIWASTLLELDKRTSSKRETQRFRALYTLVGSQYQHALFGSWPRLPGKGLRGELRSIGLQEDPTLLGLHYFLSSGRGYSVPATLSPQLNGICDVLDPALADPDSEIQLSSRTTVQLRDIDARFSHSVGEGFTYVRPYHCLSALEGELLTRLANADSLLSSADVRRRAPAVAGRVQLLVRDFACRLVRRTLGVRTAVLKDGATLQAFQRVVEGDPALMHEAVKQVEGLLNDRDHFVVSLNTTFGEPLPPEQRRAILTTSKQKVKPREVVASGRPAAPIRFMSVGTGSSSQSIPLTYELFASVRGLQSGMLPASLPRTVVALLDTTRAKLAGRVVRDEEQLDGSEIHLGTRDEVIVRELEHFLVRRSAD
jgi:hypothetical protein